MNLIDARPHRCARTILSDKGVPSASNVCTQIGEQPFDSTHLRTDSPFQCPFVSPNISPNRFRIRHHPPERSSAHALGLPKGRGLASPRSTGLWLTRLDDSRPASSVSADLA